MNRGNAVIALAVAMGAMVLGAIQTLTALLTMQLVADDPISTPVPTVSASVDPYDLYLQFAPSDAPYLTREDAQTRAYLGCGQNWAPGTVDAALAAAYRGICPQ